MERAMSLKALFSVVKFQEMGASGFFKPTTSRYRKLGVICSVNTVAYSSSVKSSKKPLT